MLFVFFIYFFFFNIKVDIPSFRTLGFGGIVAFSSRLNLDLSKGIFLRGSQESPSFFNTGLIFQGQVALLSSENYRGRLVFIPKVLGDLFLTIIAIS